MPLVALLMTLFSGYSPNMAAFMGLTFCIIVGFSTYKKPLTMILPAAMMTFILWRVSNGAFSPVMGGLLVGLLILSLMHKTQRRSMKELFDSFHVGVGYALAVGAACAAVGIVVGVINTTGIAFRLGFMVTTGARDMADMLYAMIGWIPLDMFAQASMQQFLSLVLIAIACILMGAGPFRTGVSAFTLGIGKLVVPMVFVYAPTMLIVLPEHFTLVSFLHVSLTCALGIFTIATAVSGYFLAPLSGLWRAIMAVVGLFHANGHKGGGSFHAVQTIGIFHVLVQIDRCHIGAIELGNPDPIRRIIGTGKLRGQKDLDLVTLHISHE